MIFLLAALAQGIDGLDGATGPFFARAEAELVAGDYAQAAGFYRLVLGRDPGYVPASLGLGQALAAAGERAEAIAVYRALGDEADAVEALALLLEPEDPPAALALWRRLETLRLGDPLPFRAQVRLLLAGDLDGALSAWATYTALLLDQPPDPVLLVALSDALLATRRTSEAETLLREHLEAFPEADAAIRDRLDRLEVERAADAVALGGAERLGEADSARFRRAVARLRAGDVDEAEEVARALVAGVPRSADARGFLADVLIRRDQLAEAESHAVLARTLAPEDPSHRVRLARVYRSVYGGRREGDAAAELREAAALRPEDGGILLELARTEQAVGNWTAAEAALERVLLAVPVGAEAEEARTRLAQLRQPFPGVPASPPGDTPPMSRAARIALVYLARGQEERAVTEVAGGLVAAPADTGLLNLDARLRRQRGDLPGAVAALERSLAIDPSQAHVLVARGEIASGAGDLATAEAVFRAAAELGMGDAHYLLARLAHDRGDWAVVEAEIAAWTATAPADSIYAPAAALLRDEVTARRRVTVALWATLAGVGLGVPGWILWRRRTAVALRSFVEAHPIAGHEVARVCAVLRHEVLKHRTTVMPALAESLERRETAAWTAWRADGNAVLARVDATIEGIEALGRQRGVRMDLRGADPVFSPLYRALRRAARTRRPSAAAVRGWSRAVNETAYASLGEIVAACAIVPISASVVRAVFARVGEEPGLRGGPRAELEVEEGGTALRVRMYAEDRDDILANLVRNALTAGANRVSVRLLEETDPVTAVAWAEIRVGDDAPGEVTDAMIRGRAISRGLGLARDLVVRNGGILRAARGEKALIVQFPAVEA